MLLGGARSLVFAHPYCLFYQYSLAKVYWIVSGYVSTLPLAMVQEWKGEINGQDGGWRGSSDSGGADLQRIAAGDRVAVADFDPIFLYRDRARRDSPVRWRWCCCWRSGRKLAWAARIAWSR